VALLNGARRKRHPDKSADRAQRWATVQPRLRTKLEGYIEQTRLSLRPATMVRVEAVVREFAVWLTADAPRSLRSGMFSGLTSSASSVTSRRGHRSVAAGGSRPSVWASNSARSVVCLERLSEWDGEDAPPRVRMSARDIPRRDQPLPRFIDDAHEGGGAKGIGEKQLERVRADLSEYGLVGVGWADPGKERAEPLTWRPR
jgi:hypothetical protein